MDEFIFTPKGYEALLAAIRKTEHMLNKSTRMRTDAGAGQDDWHDEQYQRAMIEEEMWDARLKELKTILSKSRIVEPQEQDETVELGNGVRIQYKDGSILEFVMQGCMLSMLEDITFVSIHSPLGQAIVGANVGDTVSFRVGKNERTVKILKILPPSRADTIFENQQDGSDRQKNKGSG